MIGSPSFATVNEPLNAGSMGESSQGRSECGFGYETRDVVIR